MTHFANTRAASSQAQAGTAAARAALEVLEQAFAYYSPEPAAATARTAENQTAEDRAATTRTATAPAPLAA